MTLLNQNNTQKQILSTFLSLWLTVHHTVNYFQLPTVKMFEMSAHYVNTGTRRFLHSLIALSIIET